MKISEFRYVARLDALGVADGDAEFLALLPMPSAETLL
jgi:hypothetical protein